MDNKDLKFYLEDENGNKNEYDVLYTFHSDVTNRDYIIYTDGTKDIDNDLELLAGAYNPNSSKIVLEAINDEEWSMIEDYINQIITSEDE